MEMCFVGTDSRCALRPMLDLTLLTCRYSASFASLLKGGQATDEKCLGQGLWYINKRPLFSSKRLLGGRRTEGNSERGE